ncbi:MAG: alpha/beta fold hydrolase [Phycisphaerales bacterium]|nr:alpha/beta fold hydrolase [Phycisphaerales bacterium]
MALPFDLARRTRTMTLGNGVPALLAHPDWETPAPFLLWIHGRTVEKELDAGRYLRLVRAGIGAVAIDLPGHGQRPGDRLHDPKHTLDVLAQIVSEIDSVLESLADPAVAGGVFDLDRAAIGGMSAGGMAALRRLCDPHPFVCAAVESTTGDLRSLYAGAPGRPWPAQHPAEKIAALDPMQHLDGTRPIPLLVLHSEADEVIPAATMRGFMHALQARYEAKGASPDLIKMVTWPTTGAPSEHAGFGRHGNDAKNLQVAFLREHLRP